FFSSRRRHTRLQGDWSSDVCSSDLIARCSASADAVLSLIDGLVVVKNGNHTSEYSSEDCSDASIEDGCGISRGSGCACTDNPTRSSPDSRSDPSIVFPVAPDPYLTDTLPIESGFSGTQDEETRWLANEFMFCC